MTKIIQTRMQHSSPDTKTKNAITNKQQQNNQYNINTELLHVLIDPLTSKVASHSHFRDLLNYERLNRNIFIIYRTFHKNNTFKHKIFMHI